MEDRQGSPHDTLLQTSEPDTQNVTMCDAGHDGEDKKDEEQWSLDTLPVEIFLHICSYFDARFLTCTLRLVCKHLYVILSDNSIWKSRIGKRWNQVYPALPVNPERFNWRLACTAIEDEYNRWSKSEQTMRRVVIKDIHYASVDAILLMNSGSLLISGSRDHSLVAWKMEPVGLEMFPRVLMRNAHKGWIWNLAASGNTLYSCSWDATVKTWLVEEGLREVATFQCKHAVLSLACNDSLVSAGLYTRAVMLFDPRSGTEFVSSYFAHTGPVLSLIMTDDYIVSASEDKTLAVWDQRAGKIFKKKITLGENLEGGNTEFPLCLSLQNDILYVGDSKGQLHIMNPTQGLFELVETYSIGHTGKLTGIQHSAGCILTSSTDHTLRVLTPTHRPEPIAVIQSQAGEVTRFDYKNNILAMGGTECAVEIWRPTSCEAD